MGGGGAAGVAVAVVVVVAVAVDFCSEDYGTLTTNKYSEFHTITLENRWSKDFPNVT
jgi:hypothetical protein